MADVEHYVLENGVITHNTGIYYSADDIWVVGRRQDKDGDELTGYEFVINIEKSRHVQEKSKFPITVSFDGGIKRWSGMLDLAVDLGYITKPAKGKYALVGNDDVVYTEKQIKNNSEFWTNLFKTTDFSQKIKHEFRLSESGMIDLDDEGVDDLLEHN